MNQFYEKVAELRKAVAEVEAKMTNPDMKGVDDRPPTGDDYNELFATVAGWLLGVGSLLPEPPQPREYAIELYGLPKPTWLTERRDEDGDLVQPLTSDPTLAALYTEAEARALWAEISLRFPAASFRLDRLATPARIAQLETRLRDIATGARSKASLLASKSPTSTYADPVQILRALADEAEQGLRN